MLSYLHGFHAGNHADVLKHVVLLGILARLTVKEAPLRYIETHAGAGGYDLLAPEAQKNREHESGIGKIWQLPDPPPRAAALLALARQYGGGRVALERYPGSPWLALAALRANDSAYLFELHPAEHRTLSQAFAARRNVTVLRQDGLEGCVGLVPPPERRGLVFIDPSYETKDEHDRVVDALVKAHRRFATGVYAIWYPVLERRRVERFERDVRAAAEGALDVYELCVAPDARGRGLTGSGMLVVNPPWRLREDVEESLQWIARALAPDPRRALRIVSAAR
jgi:23S rRNA (adenine2030-N6)-methyltransferase